MIRTGIKILLGVALLAAESLAVKGVAVSVAWRYSDLNWGAFNPKCPENNMYNWAERGSIVRFNIDGSSVTCDTIHSRANGFAVYPTLSFDGTRVAFYRYWRLGKSPTSGRDTLLDKNVYHLSVVNIDGSGLRDLCALPAEPYSENALDWPASDWIYYVRSRTNGARTMDIWRVNVSSGVNESVCTLAGDGWIRRFSLNLQADRASIQIVPGPSGSGANNGAVCFPPTNCNASSCWAGGAGSCNTSLTTSGGYVSGYSNGGHDRVELAKIAGTVGPDPYLPYVRDVRAWTHDCVANLQGGCDSIAGDGEVIRWAVNSDKWVLQQYGWWGHADAIRLGTNQILINWVDKQAVVPSSNPKIPNDPVGGGGGVVYYGNCPGDFWVDGGAANLGKYEDANGAWISVPGYYPTQSSMSPAARSKLQPCAPSVDAQGNICVRITRAGHATVRLIDMRGKTVFSSVAEHAISIPARQTRPGTYLVEVSGAGGSNVSKVTISR